MPKAFLGLDCEIQELKEYQQQFEGLRLTQPLHITLKFLDECTPEQIQEIIKLSKKVFAKKVTTSTGKLTTFGNEQATRLLILDIEKTPSIMQLQSKIDRVTQHIYEKKPVYNPHITVARSKEKVSTTNFPSIAPVKITATKFHLYQKTKDEKHYRVTHSFVLH